MCELEKFVHSVIIFLLLMALCRVKMLMIVSVFDQIGSKSCCLDSVLHLHLAMGWNWSTVESGSETPF